MTTTPTIDAPIPSGHRVLHRMVMPTVISPETLPLYIETEPSPGPVNEDSGHYSRAGVDPNQALTRRSFTVPAGAYRSLGTYFNAFPASYWRRWTPVREVTLTVTTEGTGSLVIYRSNAKGASQRVDSAELEGSATSSFTLPLTAFGDGGWYWVDVQAGSTDLEVTGAWYSAAADLARATGTFSISMTTMNKVSYCLENIRTLLENEDLLETMDAMYIIDQGSDRLHDHEDDLAPLQEGMGAKLQIIEQGNIGGSGGFSRGMYETATAEVSDYVINCDDDIVIEPESLRRLVAFADYATTPTIVGAHMFDLNNRSVLHTFGEVVDRWRIQPALPHQEMSLAHDLALKPLRQTAWLHRRADVDYNGWWMCLIPTQVVREIGLSLPVFIKWDDVEYGLRAKDAGYNTVSFPGAGVWHMAWGDKDDLVGWQAFYHERNRLITALLYSPYERGGRLITESQFMDIKHVISMQYYTETGRLLAQRDVLSGPEHLHQTIGTTLPEIRSLAGSFPDSTGKKDIADYPATKEGKPPRRGKGFSQPTASRLPLWTAKQIAKQLLSAPTETSREHPQAVISHQDARWWRLSHYDSALVSNAEGTQVSWYKRDRAAARSMLLEAARTHAQLLASWGSLRESFKAAAPELTSFESWERTFAANPAPKREEPTT